MQATINRAELPSVSEAYSREAWSNAIAPMVKQLTEYFPDKKAAFSLFFESYQRDYFRLWGEFLKRVPEGVALWSGRYDQLIDRAPGRDSPYVALWDALDDNLYSLPISIPLGTRWSVAWAQIKEDPWSTHASLWHLLTDSVRASLTTGVLRPPAWVPAVLDYRYRVLAKQRAAYAKAYLRLQGDDAGQESYQVASEIFKSNGNPTQPPAADYAPLLQSVDKPDENFSTKFTPEDQAAWSIVQGPSRLLLVLTLHRAGQFLQAKWQESVMGPIKDFPEKDQRAALYGEGGRLNGFINDWLKPFVSEKEKQPVKVAGVALPVSANYGELLSNDRALSPGLDPAKIFFVGAFQFTQPSSFGKLQEGQLGSTLELDCKDRMFVASTRADAEPKASVFWSPQSCPEARIRVGLPETPAATPAPAAAAGQPLVPVAAAAPSALPRLTKTYVGSGGFLALLQDFRNGTHTYALSELRGSNSAAQWQDISQKAAALGVREVRVHLQIQLSDEMQRYLSSRGTIAALPTQLFE